MNKCLLLLLVALLFGVFFDADGQSRRVLPQTKNEKPNQRDPALSATPTPKPTPEDDTMGIEDSGEIISVDTKLVTVPVRILDRKNRFIGGLVKENFTIFEDRVQQEVAYFTNEAQPFTVALVLDMSYSTTFRIEDIQNAAIAFIDQLRPEDQVMVISFDEEVHMLCEATSDRKVIYGAIRSTRISTGTSLYEAVDLTMNSRLRSIKGRKAIVLFTDGVDTTSRSSHDLENLRDAMELDALIYPIRYDTFADVQSMKNKVPLPLPGGLEFPGGLKLPDSVNIPRRNPSPDPRNTPRNDRYPSPQTRPSTGDSGQKGTTVEEYQFAEEYLNQLALRTGGRVHFASTYGNLNASFAKIASELREFYSIGYYPKSDGEPGRTRRIKVRVNQENLVVRARDSYVVPSADKRRAEIAPH
ncbi:MAG: VWA domain-containing protein [Pyrinomonadaceae bacterium]